MKTKTLLNLVISLAFLLRLFKLGEFPATLYGDEQAFAWNAYNILLTGEDEYGNPYPLQFRSFDDYKAPIPVYLLVPFIKYLDLNTFAIRLPIAIASVLTVVVTYHLARLFFKQKLSLLVSFLMAVSPWHVHLSRGYFEATLTLLFFVLGVYFFLRSKLKFKSLLVPVFFFTLSVYTYFTPRILVPIFLVFLFCYYQRGSTSYEVEPRRKAFLLSLFFLVLLSLPLVKATLFDQGFSRFNKLKESRLVVIEKTVNQERNASNLSPFWKMLFHNKATILFRLIKNDYLEHLSPNFWYIFGDNSLRYFTGNMGMFYLLEFPFMILGLYYLFCEKRSTAVFFLGWILLSPIPASIVGRSFAVRSLAMLPAPFIFVGYGIYKSIIFFNNIHFTGSFTIRGVSASKRIPLGGAFSLRNLLSVIITLAFVFSLGSLLIRYYLEYPVYAATWWGWENKAAIDYAKAREAYYDYIFISDFYTGAPLAYAVYTKQDPLAFRQAVDYPIIMADGRHLIKLGKYYFGSLDIDKERLEQNIIPPNSLYIGRPEEADSDETINAPDDGRVIFKIYRT